LANKDFDLAEKHLKESAKVGSKLAENEGSTKVQLGMVSLQKGNFMLVKYMVDKKIYRAERDGLHFAAYDYYEEYKHINI
jgi:hypothetical protein